MDIFNYLKEREQHFIIESYMHRQPHLTAWMRTLLVDWMVEVQETFELNHETLYLAVKLVDIYLGKVVVIKEKLQLLGAAALFMACKYDVSCKNSNCDFTLTFELISSCFFVVNIFTGTYTTFNRRFLVYMRWCLHTNRINTYGNEIIPHNWL